MTKKIIRLLLLLCLETIINIFIQIGIFWIAIVILLHNF